MLYGSTPSYSSGYDSQLSHRSPITGVDDISQALVPAKSNSTWIRARHSSLESSTPSDVHQSGTMSLSGKGVQVVCWCTYCSRDFRTKDGWSRHEKEAHENHVYLCMPDGPVEIRGRGPECSICGTPNPDEDHLNTHQLARCLEKSVSSREYKRRCDLVSHLSGHGAPNCLGLAEQWKRTPPRKARACGFCVRIFFQRMDRINHIYNEHWINGANMSDWNPSMVIQGLLLQPLLRSRWSEFLSKDFMFDPSKITWHPSIIKDLQRRLEVVEEPPETLVAAAYDLVGQGNNRNTQTAKRSVAQNPKPHAPWQSIVSAQNANPNRSFAPLPTRAVPTSETPIPASISALSPIGTQSMTREQYTSCLIYPPSGHENTSSFYGSPHIPDLLHLRADMQAPLNPDFRHLTNEPRLMNRDPETDLIEDLHATAWGNPPAWEGAGEMDQLNWQTLL